MDATAANYNADATIDDGSCSWDCPLTPGGVDVTETDCYNFVWNGGYSIDEVESYGYDCSCVEAPIPGCMDPEASNYDETATQSTACTYDCADNETELQLTMTDSYGDGWNGATMTIGDLSFSGPVADTETTLVCIDMSVCNAIVVGGGSYDSEISWTLGDLSGNAPFEGEIGNCVVDLPGCTDEAANNFNADANVDDGSCNYPVCQNIDIPEGWSIFSTYIIPQIDSLDELLLPIVNNIENVKDFEGTAYIPDYNFNGIGTLSIGQGYQSKLYAPSSIDVCGEYASPELTPISLNEGWNMVGYLRIDPAPADLVLEEIATDGNLVIAKDYLGLAYLPDWNFNAIGDMQATQGYQIKVSQDDILLYLSNENSYRMSAMEVTQNNVSHYSKVAATDNNMTVVIEDAAWDIIPTEGAEIAAFDKYGNMVGSAVYSSPVTVVTVWGDDATTTSKDGMLVSESVSFKVWNNNEVSDFTVAKWIEGSSSYQVDGISVASTIETNNMITELNASERVLVKVINVLGQEVNMDDQPFKGTVLFNVYDDGSVERFIR